jgi:hypothetical protein
LCADSKKIKAVAELCKKFIASSLQHASYECSIQVSKRKSRSLLNPPAAEVSTREIQQAAETTLHQDSRSHRKMVVTEKYSD